MWSQASNWNVNGEVATSAPTATSNVYIDDGSPNVSVVTVDVIDAAANNLTLDSDDTLTFYSNATLTVSGSATLNGTTNIGLGELRLNGPSTNTGTITLSQVLVTLPSGIQVVQSQGQLDGSGTLTNTGTIQGSGRISLSLTNSGLIVASDSSNTLQIFANVNNSGGIVRGFNGTIALQGATVTGGVVDGNIYANNGAVLNGAQFAGADPGVGATITSGSTLGIQGIVTNAGTLDLKDGVTLTGPGTISNQAASEIIAQGQVDLQVNVTQASNGILRGLASSGGLVVLDGVTVTGGVVDGNIAAKNGAVLNGAQFGGADPGDVTTLAGGSTLGIQGTVTNVAGLTLGSGGLGATLNGSGTIVNNSTIQGGGVLGVAISNNGSITANDPTAALVIAGNVTAPKGTGSLAVSNGATMTFDGVTVDTQTMTISAGSVLNGTGTLIAGTEVVNAGTAAPGMGAPGMLTIDGVYAQIGSGALDFALGGDGLGQYSQLDLSGPAGFATGNVIEAEFVDGFDPTADCAGVTGVCETFDVLNVASGGAPSPLDFKFDLPTLTDGLSWTEVDSNNELLLEITSSGELTGGGGSGGTSVPEPSSLPMLCMGLAAVGSCAAFKRLRQSRA
ncbi:MAG TPA: PEP-CTERM sorting domain-containing protein [Candidatus Acidoferrales bacterium]|nr:PEP-CTERM sorting domain-containing protein [Candidatus Acidoferrales bacterium]